MTDNWEAAEYMLQRLRKHLLSSSTLELRKKADMAAARLETLLEDLDA